MIGLLALAAGATVGLPIPQQFQHNTTVVVRTMTQAEIDRECGTYAGYATLACADEGKPSAYMPNPCAFPEAQAINSYAHLLCHEIAHTEGWHHDDPPRLPALMGHGGGSGQ